jgi:DNA-binding transcriptional MerR regulator
MARTAPEPIEQAAIEEGLTVQQTVERTGLSEHTLRYYERAGLLQQVRRQDSSRHRRYSSADLARIQTLACLRATGMPLDQMRRYFELAAQGPAAAPQLQALLEEQRDELEHRIELMHRHLEYVTHKIAYWRAIEAHDDGAAELARQLAGRILAEAQRPTDSHRLDPNGAHA